MECNIYTKMKPPGCFSAPSPYAPLDLFDGGTGGWACAHALRGGLMACEQGEMMHAHAAQARAAHSFMHSPATLMHCIIYDVCMYICI